MVASRLPEPSMALDGPDKRGYSSYLRVVVAGGYALFNSSRIPLEWLHAS
jgi:hypothetical protein